MARTKTTIDEVTEGKEENIPEKVTENKKTKTLFLEKIRGKNVNQQIFASHNGRDYIIQRGVPVEVPIGVYELVMNSIQAKDEAYAYIEKTANDL